MPAQKSVLPIPLVAVHDAIEHCDHVTNLTIVMHTIVLVHHVMLNIFHNFMNSCINFTTMLLTHAIYFQLLQMSAEAPLFGTHTMTLYPPLGWKYRKGNNRIISSH